MPAIPSIEFKSRSVPVKERLDVWNGHHERFLEVVPAEPGIEFTAGLKAYYFDGLILTQSFGPGFINRRPKTKVSRFCADSIAICLSVDPRTDIVDHSRVVSPGNMQFLDYTREFQFQYPDKNRKTLALTFDRRTLARYVPQIDALHGTQWEAVEVRARLFARTMAALSQAAPDLMQADGDGIVAIAGELLAACLIRKSLRTEPQNLAIDDARRLLAAFFIESRLRDPDLGPNLICTQCGISRSVLYDLFKEQGGIANYIWARRLERAAINLRNPATNHLSLGQIAESLGFMRQSHFSVAFKRRFGLNAKDYRDADALTLSALSGGMTPFPAQQLMTMVRHRSR